MHLTDWPEAPAAWTNPTLVQQMDAVFQVRARVNEAIEPLRASGQLGKSLDAAVTVTGDPADPLLAALLQLEPSLAELFIVSHVRLVHAPGQALTVSVEPCEKLGFVRCPRCWRWVPALQSTTHGEVCPRCAEALS